MDTAGLFLMSMSEIGMDLNFDVPCVEDDGQSTISDDSADFHRFKLQILGIFSASFL